ncbi:MAG: hypothetical protein COA42_16625 [Alteromonadaceae bacterium]|nr:MAG: hypothetical protein COA42_16625 [Alteromonadaceae bacterium]
MLSTLQTIATAFYAFLIKYSFSLSALIFVVPPFIVAETDSAQTLSVNKQSTQASVDTAGNKSTRPLVQNTPRNIQEAEQRYLRWCAKMGREDVCQTDLDQMKQRKGDQGVYTALNTLGISFWCLNQSKDAEKIVACSKNQIEAEQVLKRTYLAYLEVSTEAASSVMRTCSPLHVREYTDKSLKTLLDDYGIPYHDTPGMLSCVKDEWAQAMGS